MVIEKSLFYSYNNNNSFHHNVFTEIRNHGVKRIKKSRVPSFPDAIYTEQNKLQTKLLITVQSLTPRDHPHCWRVIFLFEAQMQIPR